MTKNTSMLQPIRSVDFKIPTLFEKMHGYHTGLLPSKVASKYKLLTENRFRFFRGTNNLFYEDLSSEIIPPLSCMLDLW